MASLDFAALGLPVSEEEPCGPDLDLSGDADYMKFLATAEGFLPGVVLLLRPGRDRFRTALKTNAELLARSRDVRLLTTLAKLLILNRDLEGFVASIGLLATLLGDRWQDVHPRGEDGDFGVRMASLTTLDDLPPVVLPLQYVPLVQHKRHGPIAYRHQMIATGEVSARDGELALDVAAVERALMEVELADLAKVARTDGRASGGADAHPRGVHRAGRLRRGAHAREAARPRRQGAGLPRWRAGQARSESRAPRPRRHPSRKEKPPPSPRRGRRSSRVPSPDVSGPSPMRRRRSPRRRPISVETSRRARLCCSSARPSSSSASLSWN